MVRVAGYIGLALVLVGIFLQSYNGRQDVVGAQRQGCERSSRNAAASVNHDRIDQGSDVALAEDSAVPVSVRAERRREAASQEQLIAVIDRNIDRGMWRLLSDRRDRRVVREGRFRCDVAYPEASPFQFVH